MVASIFDWSVTAADNDDADTDINWLEGQQGSTVNNSARAIMAKVAAVVKMMRGAYTTTNSGNAYALAVDFPPASLAKGWFGIVRFNAGNTGAATLEITPLAATTLRDAEGTALASGAIVANALYLVAYDTTASQYRIVSKVSSTLTSANITDFTEATQDVVGALTGFGGTGLTFTYNDGAGTVALAVDLSELTAEATIATDDYIPIVDTSETSASNKMLVSDFLKVVNALTEDASPDTANDFLLSYDTSAGAAKKVKPSSIASATAVTVIRSQVFTASGTYTPHANMLYCVVTVTGGGGGGGGSDAGNTGEVGGGAGGGAGGTSRKIISKATIGASQVVTIGAGGTAGNTSGSTGGTGGASSLGALAVGNGGVGGEGSGTVNSAFNVAFGGLGGTASAGDTNTSGGSGGNGIGFAASTSLVFALGGTGGASFWGSGGIGGAYSGAGGGGGTGVAGVVGLAPGSGGGGGASTEADSALGGVGAPGIIEIIEYCSA